MAIFLVFYKLFLENESMHVFKRYFQLAAIAISLVIPAVVFTEVVYIAPISTSFALTEDYSLETYLYVLVTFKHIQFRSAIL